MIIEVVAAAIVKISNYSNKLIFIQYSPVLSTLQVFSHLIFIIIYEVCAITYHFIAEETEILKGKQWAPTPDLSIPIASPRGQGLE